jgi:hypothetical protein
MRAIDHEKMVSDMPLVHAHGVMMIVGIELRSLHTKLVPDRTGHVSELTVIVPRSGLVRVSRLPEKSAAQNGSVPLAVNDEMLVVAAEIVLVVVEPVETDPVVGFGVVLIVVVPYWILLRLSSSAWKRSSSNT